MALPARPYDPLYDTTYTVSGARDHYRQQTVAGGFMIEKAPEYPNMFSELPHFPATSYRLKNSDKVPEFVDRTFQPEFRDGVDLELRSQATMVSGQQRYKYFRRPMLAAGQPVLIKQAIVPPIPAPPAPVPEPASKTVGTQSDFRENEAQTLPWAPPVRLPDTVTVKQQYLSDRHHCQGPELLQLTDLKFGDGLPPGLQEVRRVEKLRAKRAFEATLPPLNDLDQLPLRQKMIEEWEAKEWEEREQEMHSVQDERLTLIDQALQVREEEIEQGSAARVEQRKMGMLQDKAPAFAAVQANRIKTMRQLIESRKFVETHRKLIKPGIVEKYANFGSTVYAPVQRDGRFPESKPHGKIIETEGYQPVTLQAINELQASLPAKMLVPKNTNPLTQPQKLDYKQRKDVSVQKDLKAISQLLDTARTTKGLGFGDCWPAPLKDSEAALVSAGNIALKSSKDKPRRSVVRAVERPDSPELPPPAHMTAGAEKDAAAVLLQRLLRGRAAQNLMYEGKVRRAELIQELLLEGSEQASLSRPEDQHPAITRLDAILGSMISRLAVALTTQDPQQRAELLQQAMIATAGTQVDLTGLPAVQRSRASTPLQAVRVDGEGVASSSAPVTSCEDEGTGVQSQALTEQDVGHREPAAQQDAVDAQITGVVNSQVTDAVTQANVKVLGDAPVVEGTALVEAATNAAGLDAAVQAGPADSTAGDSAGDVTGDDSAAAATRIQATYKGYKARKEVAAMRADVTITPDSPAEPAVAPSSTDALQQDKETATSDALQQEEEAATPDDDAAAAATRIQATYKGYKARKEVAAMRSGTDNGAADADPQSLQADEDLLKDGVSHDLAGQFDEGPTAAAPAAAAEAVSEPAAADGSAEQQQGQEQQEQQLTQQHDVIGVAGGVVSSPAGSRPNSASLHQSEPAADADTRAAVLSSSVEPQTETGQAGEAAASSQEDNAAEGPEGSHQQLSADTEPEASVVTQAATEPETAADQAADVLTNEPDRAADVVDVIADGARGGEAVDAVPASGVPHPVPVVGSEHSTEPAPALPEEETSASSTSQADSVAAEQQQPSAAADQEDTHQGDASTRAAVAEVDTIPGDGVQGEEEYTPSGSEAGLHTEATLGDVMRTDQEENDNTADGSASLAPEATLGAASEGAPEDASGSGSGEGVGTGAAGLASEGSDA